VATAKIVPQWAPRVPQAQVRRLYENDARGIYDDELIDEVGYTLRARCQSFLAANEARQGRAICPRCDRKVPHSGAKEEVLHCDGCGWELTWGEYFETFQKKQLFGAEPVLQLFQEFVTRFPSAATPREKVLLIDRVIHGWHWYQKHGHTRPVAVNLIGGKLPEVIAFLDRLTYGEGSTPGTRETHAELLRNSETVRRWSRAGDRDAPAEETSDGSSTAD
jgi:ribosomal protein L37AE/L43A